MRCAAAALAAARAAEAIAASAMTDEEALALFRLSLSEPEPERDPPLARSSASTTSSSSAGLGADANRSATPRRISQAAKRSGSVKSRYPRYVCSSLSSQARAASSHAFASARARARSDAETFFACSFEKSNSSPRATPSTRSTLPSWSRNVAASRHSGCHLGGLGRGATCERSLSIRVSSERSVSDTETSADKGGLGTVGAALCHAIARRDGRVSSRSRVSNPSIVAAAAAAGSGVPSGRSRFRRARPSRTQAWPRRARSRRHDSSSRRADAPETNAFVTRRSSETLVSSSSEKSSATRLACAAAPRAISATSGATSVSATRANGAWRTLFMRTTNASTSASARAA
mmetsp:Transcript_8869/g.37234  ORF Transcript_8869/g.37234 Transcript_8869/m.37234 type:complete len:347 (-) Transcript_8869:2277-3317(-)